MLKAVAIHRERAEESVRRVTNALGAPRGLDARRRKHKMKDGGSVPIAISTYVVTLPVFQFEIDSLKVTLSNTKLMSVTLSTHHELIGY
jgi:hypothetical protein